MTIEKKQYQPDTIMKDFFRKKDNFIDVMNGTLFQGNNYVEDAVELDTEEGTTTESGSKERRRDLLKLVSVKGKEVIIGIENQQTPDKTMTYRDMEYTILKYGIRSKDKVNKDIPIMTVVIFCGCKKWNYQTELQKMMDIPEEIESYFNNWKTIVIDAKNVDHEIFQTKEVKDFFEGLQNLYSWDKDVRHLKDIELTYDTALTLGVVTGTEALIKKAENMKGGMIHMCQAVDEALQEREEYGMRTGKLENVDKLINKKFKKKATWLDSCTIKQLDKALDLIFDELSYNQFKNEVLKQ